MLTVLLDRKIQFIRLSWIVSFFLLAMYRNNVVSIKRNKTRLHNDVKFIWNNSYMNCGCRCREEWSSQLIFQFKQLERRSLKKSGLLRDSNPWPPRYRCDALPTELWSHTLGTRSINWVHIFPWGVKWWAWLSGDCLNVDISNVD